MQVRAVAIKCPEWHRDAIMWYVFSTKNPKQDVRPDEEAKQI